MSRADPTRPCRETGLARFKAGLSPTRRSRSAEGPATPRVRPKGFLRAQGLPWCLLATLTLGCGARGGSPTFPGAPVILISVDTLRADHLPAYGYTKLQTPHLDTLARDSILFENAYSHCPLTLPSHLSILTGLLPADHGVRDNIGYRFDGGTHKTLSRILKAHGYTTGGAVSAYVLRGTTGIRDSMDFFDDSVAGPGGGVQDLSLAQRPGRETVERALAWAEGVKSRPFFLFLHIYEPHTPYEPPEPFRSRYGPTYDGEIATSDAIIGDFLEELKHKGVYDSSIIVFLSDHGEGLGEHGEQEHGILLYREVLHVPLLLKLPRSREAGTRLSEPVGLVDVMPTVTALLGVETPEHLDGTSLLDPGARKESSEGRGVYAETYYPRIHLGWSELRSLVDARYHYIDGPKPELYKVIEDRAETADARSSEPTVARRMKAELGRFEPRFSGPTEIDPEAAEKLRALGYLSGTSPVGDGEKLKNPRDEIHLNEDLKAAFQLEREGRDDEALRALRQLLKSDPGCFDAQRQLAGTLARLGRYQEAAEAYKQAMRLSPSLATDVALSLGQMELDMGRLDEAAANARAALKDEPGHAHELLASVALSRGDVAGAETEARLSLAEGPDPSAAMVLARVYIRRSELPRALAALDEAVAPEGAGGRVPGFEYVRGDVLARLGRYPEAEASFRNEIRSFPKDSNAYASLAVVLALAGRSKNEIHELLESMVRAKPTRETALQAKKTLEFIGDQEGANAWQHWARPQKSGSP
jgi:arylsulfatase A-like enzyme/Tfp pilus assembly protein PilF